MELEESYYEMPASKYILQVISFKCILKNNLTSNIGSFEVM